VKLCNVLIGYVVANPWTPKAGTPAARQVAVAALRFLRGVAQTSYVPRTAADCRVLGQFPAFMYGLGAVASQAVALRVDLLKHRATIKPPLSLSAG
jgi:hypothetical protein